MQVTRSFYHRRKRDAKSVIYKKDKGSSEKENDKACEVRYTEIKGTWNQRKREITGGTQWKND